MKLNLSRLKNSYYSWLQDVGDGWWEGSIRNKVGLFPETYVKLGDDSENEWDDDEHEQWEESRGPRGMSLPGVANADSSTDARSPSYR